MRDLLLELSSIPAVSGHEDAMIDRMYDGFTAFTKDVWVDRIGNVAASFEGARDGAPSVMVFAHMDEIGFMVSGVTDGGFLRVERIGGINRRITAGLPVDVWTAGGKIEGITGVKSHHYMTDADKQTVPGIEELYIDIGAESREQAAALGAVVGCVVSFRPVPSAMSGSRLSAKTLDNRVGCLCLLELARRLAQKPTPCAVHLVATVQEEFNLRGAETAARRIAPDIAVVLDITPACDTPDLAGKNDVRLGGGPVLVHYDFHGRGMLAGLIPPPRLVSLVAETAGAACIPLQHLASSGILTDASGLPYLGDGIAAVSVAVPMRYSHTPVETVDLHDIGKTCDLMEAFLGSMTAGVRADRRRGL